MNPIKTQINTLLNKEMNRKDFLKHVAVGVVAVSGVGTALRLLSVEQKKSQHVGAAGYGGMEYGGKKVG